MTGKTNPIPSYLNTLSRIILWSMEEIIGHNGLIAVLNQADLKHMIHNLPPDNREPGIKFGEISRIHIALEQLYGPRGGRGLALRSGRVFFRIGLREFGDELGLTSNDFRLLPLNNKILATLEKFAILFNQYSDQNARVDEQDERILWITDQCPLCWNRHTDTQVCYFLVGILQESLYWVSGGKFFNVEEIECTAVGDTTCTIAIDKAPLD